MKLYRKLFLVALILSAGSFFSCSDDDENPLKVSGFTLSQDTGVINLIINASGNYTYFEMSAILSDYDYGPDGGQKVIIYNDTASVSLDDFYLEKNKLYNFYVRAIGADASYSSWTGPLKLTIARFCELPYDLNFSSYLVWDYYYNETDASYYEVEYGLHDFTPGAGIKITTNSTYSDKMILEMGKTYDFYVKAYCTENLGWSDQTGPASYYAESNLNLLMLPTNVGWQVERNFFGEPVGASFTWLDAGNNPSYEFNLVGNNLGPESNAVESGDSRTITYLSMTQSTEYDFYVRTVGVDGSRTAWVGPLSVNIGN